MFAFQVLKQMYTKEILGRPGEVWGGESGANKLVVVTTVNHEAN